MIMPIMMIMMMFVMVSFFTVTQEAPASNEESSLMESSASAASADTESTQTADEEPQTTSDEQTQETPSGEEISTESSSPDTSDSAQDLPETSSEAASDELADTATAQPATTDNTEEPQPLLATKQDSSSTNQTPKDATTAADMSQSSVIPEAPVPAPEEKLVIPEEETEKEEPVGIDTVSLENPQGNWLFKRIWWERAEERYEKIRILVDSIWESRNTFFHERNQLDRTILDPFYINIGIDRGELQTILSEINDFLEKQREQEGTLSEQERVIYETYATEEETLKQLKADVDAIVSLDHAIDDALGTFMNQINRVRQFESQAWNNFKEIAHILNDTRARELYYMIEGAARNIKTISNYLEQEFLDHFHKLIANAKTRVNRVQTQMNALKEKGVLFQRQAELLEQQAAQEEEIEEEEDVKPKPKLSWFGWISSGISNAFSYVWAIIRLPYDMIFKK